MNLQDLSPSLARILRPQAAYRWILPYLSNITPQYIESILRGALAGNHVQAWELFDLMCDTDPEIAACVGEYCDGIVQKKLTIEAYCEEDEQPSDNAIRNKKIVSAALRNMRPRKDRDENSIKGTLRDLAFKRFHGQSILEVDYFLPDSQQPYTLNVNGVGEIFAPRTSYWVHPICYAWTMDGQLGLRVALQNQIADITRTAKNQKPGDRGAWPGIPQIGSMTEAPAWNWISSQPMPSYVQEFPANKFLIGLYKAKAGTALGGSCLRPLTWWWCVTNFAGDWLLDLGQIFGIPFRKATYQQGTPEPEKAMARQMLQDMGSRGWVLLDERVKVEFEKAMESGAQSPQGFLIELADRKKRTVILRQTMTGGHGTMGKGGGQAFGQTEKDVKAECIQAGADDVCDDLTDLARYVLNINVGDDSECPVISLQDDETGNLQDAQIVAALAPLNPKLYGVNGIRKQFNIPVPADDEETLGQAAPPAPSVVSGPSSVASGKEPKAKGKSTDDEQTANEKGGKEVEASATDHGQLTTDKRGAPTQSYQDKSVQLYANGFAEDLEHVFGRLGAILQIKDDKIFDQKLREFLDDFPQLKKDILADPKAARALQPIIATALANGLAREKEKKS